MQVFKNFFVILKRNFRVVAIYFAIFSVIMVIVGSYYSEPKNREFVQRKVSISIINRDEDSPLIKDFISYLDNFADFVDNPDDEDLLKDAVFFQEIDTAIIIPEGFTKSLEDGKDAKVEAIYQENDADVDYVNLSVNNYIATAKAFFENAKDLSETEIIKLIDDSLNVKLETILSKENSAPDSYTVLSFFTNYFVFVLTAVFIIVLTAVMRPYTKIDLKRRNLVSPMSYLKMQRQLVVGNFVFALIATTVLLLIGIAVCTGFTFTPTIVIFMLNSYIYGICAMAIGFLISQLTSNIMIANALANVIGLGSAFICGAFVPQNILSDSVLNVSRFLPGYWFIKTNNSLATMGEPNGELLKECFSNMFVVAMFAVALFAFSAVIAKLKQQENN